MRTVTLDGKVYPIREVLRIYKEQKAQVRKTRQLGLFAELPEDSRIPSQRTAAGRYAEPTLFEN
jgi:hypothetical protein